MRSVLLSFASLAILLLLWTLSDHETTVHADPIAAPAKIPEWVQEAFDKATKEIDFLTEDVFRRKISKGNWFVFFGAVWCPHCMMLTPRWLEMQKKHKEKFAKNGFYMAKVECTENVDLCEGDENINGFPTIKVYHEGLFVEEFAGDAMVQAEVDGFVDGMVIKLQNSTFINELQTGAAAHKSDDDSEPNELTKAFEAAEAASKANQIHAGSASSQYSNGSITHLTEATFDMLTANRDWYLMFHSPYCHHCIAFAPTWEKVAEKFKGKFNVGKVNCVTEKQLCARYEIEAYPTLKMVREPLPALEFEGQRTLEKVISFVEHLPTTPAFSVIHTSHLTDKLKEQATVLFYLYDHAKVEPNDLSNLASFASTVNRQFPVMVSPDPSLFTRFSLNPQNSPIIFLFKDYGTTRIKFKTESRLDLSGDSTSHRKELYEFIAKNSINLTPKLDETNSRRIMGAKNVTHIVLGLLDPSNDEAMAEFRAAAGDWAQKIAAQQQKKAPGGSWESQVPGVSFAWVDGVEKADYMKRIYGFTPKDLPQFVVAEPKEGKFHYAVVVVGRDVHGFVYSRDGIVQATELVLQGQSKFKHTFGYWTRVMQGKASVTEPVVTFIWRYQLILLVVGITLVFIMRYRTRSGGNSSYLPLSLGPKVE